MEIHFLAEIALIFRVTGYLTVSIGPQSGSGSIGDPMGPNMTHIVERLQVSLPAVSPFTRDHDCILSEAREERQLGSQRMQRIIFETGRCFDSDGFSARHSSREYGYYEQFRGFRSGPERR